MDRCVNGHPTEEINGRVICPTCKSLYQNRASRNRRLNQSKRASRRALQMENTTGAQNTP